MEVYVQTRDNDYEVSFNSESRDLGFNTDSSYFEVNLESNPLKDVKRMRLIETVIPLIEPGFTQSRYVQWGWVADSPLYVGDPAELLFPASVNYLRNYNEIYDYWITVTSRPIVQISSSGFQGMSENQGDIGLSKLFFGDPTPGTQITLLLGTSGDRVIHPSGSNYYNIIGNSANADSDMIVKIRASGLVGNSEGGEGVLPQSTQATTEYQITTIAPGQWKKITPLWTREMWEGTFTYSQLGLADPSAWKIEVAYLSDEITYDGGIQSYTISPGEIETVDDIISTLNTQMSGNGKTVTWSKSGKFISVTSSHKIHLFPLMPNRATVNFDRYVMWDYVAATLVKQLGFSVVPSDGGYSGPIIDANGTYRAPHHYNFSGPPYVLLKLEVNGQAVGRVWENDPENVRIGPYFSRIMLKNRVGDLNICETHVSHHIFSSKTTIKKLVFELVNPIVGVTPIRYNSLGRDWIANIRFEEETVDTTLSAPIDYVPTTTRREQVSTDSYADLDSAPSQFYWEQEKRLITQQ